MTQPIISSSLPGQWPVAKEYGISRGLLYSQDHWKTSPRYYRPDQSPDLPFEIAKLAGGGEQDVVNFARRWGLLGYWELRERERFEATLAARRLTGRRLDIEIPDSGEPVDWILKQADRMRLCVSLINPLQEGDGGAAASALERFFDSIAIFERRVTWENILRFKFFLGEKPTEDFPIQRSLKERPLAVASLMLDHVINDGLKWLTLRLQLEPPELHPQFDAMLQVAYLKLAQVMVKTGSVAYCEECGNAFRKTDPRQRFCPKGEMYTESRCAYRNRYGRKPRAEWRPSNAGGPTRETKDMSESKPGNKSSKRGRVEL